jgi:hypothetical protein
MKLSTITRAIVAHDLGADLHRWARRAAMIAAWLYVAGMAAGVAVHWLNDWLSGDRRAWPVRWGQWQPVDRSAKLLKFKHVKSEPISKEQAVSFSSMAFPAFIIEKTGSGRWVDLQKMSVAELRGIARSLNIRRVRALDSGNLCGLHLARKADLIAALQ